jgi:hypothetical protein
MTFTNTPPALASVNDLLVWTVYDANAIDPTKLDYRYVYECWVGGVLVHTDRVTPRPVGAFGVIDLSTVIRGYVSPTFAPGSGILAQELGVGEFKTDDIVAKIREDYNGTTGAVVLTDSARVFYNHYNDRGDTLTSLSSYANKPLSIRPTTPINLRLTTSRYFLPYYATSTTPFNVVIAGNTKTITPTAANTLLLLNISPAAVNSEYPGSVTSATESYTVALGGVTYTVNVVCKGMYTNYLVHFMNKYGGFESMLFNKPRQRSKDITKKDYRQLAYRVDDTTGAVTTESGVIKHEQTTTFAVSNTEKLRIQSDILIDSEYTWLGQLAQSPWVYLEDDGILYPVKVSASNYRFNEYLTDRLTTLSLDIEFPTKNSQYR